MTAMNCARSSRKRPDTVKKFSMRYNALLMGFFLVIIRIADATAKTLSEKNKTVSKSKFIYWINSRHANIRFIFYFCNSKFESKHMPEVIQSHSMDQTSQAEFIIIR